VSDKRGRPKAAIAGEAWGALLDLSMGQRTRFFGVLQEFGLTPGDLRALSALDQDPPPPHADPGAGVGLRRLQRDLDGRPTERRGLVERRMLPTDRRVKTVALTPLGASTKAELFTRLHEPPADLLALDRATLQALRDALARLPTSLRATGLHGRPSDGAPTHCPRA
jgi:hypothetical protein